MKMIMISEFPPEPFNSHVRDGSIGSVIGSMMETLDFESFHFVELDGCRGAVGVFNIEDSSEIPTYAEPFFLKFDAQVRFRIAMTPEDLGKAGLDALGAQWG
jgi:hypothetical protein